MEPIGRPPYGRPSSRDAPQTGRRLAGQRLARDQTQLYLREPVLRRRLRGEAVVRRRVFSAHGGCPSSCSSASSSLMLTSGLDSDLSRRKTNHEVSRSSTSRAVTDAQCGLAR